VFHLDHGPSRDFVGLLDCSSSPGGSSRFIAKVFFNCRQIMVDLRQAIRPVPPSNGNIPIADIDAVNFIGPFGHVGPGVATFPVGGKRQRTCGRITSLLVYRIIESRPEKIGIVEPKAVEDENVFFRLTELRRLRASAATGSSSRKRLSGCTHDRLKPLDNLAGAVTSVPRAVDDILCMLVDRTEQLWIERADRAYIVRRR
jgi:hypothetical protein